MPALADPITPPAPPQLRTGRAPYTAARLALIAFGCLNVALGVVGAVLPVMPSTVFFLMALWAFSKSSPRLHRWLHGHRLFGGPLRAWQRHGVIPPSAKILAVITMSASLAYVTLGVAESWVLPVSLGLILSAVATFILSRPSHPPDSDRGCPASLGNS